MSWLVVRMYEEICSFVGRKDDVSDLQHEVVVRFSLLWSKSELQKHTLQKMILTCKTIFYQPIVSQTKKQKKHNRTGEKPNWRESVQKLIASVKLFQLVTICRYIVCRGLKPGSDAVREYMFRINLKLNQLRNTDMDVTEVVPLSIIKEDTDFYQFMVNSNERYKNTVFTKALMFSFPTQWLTENVLNITAASVQSR